ncbi:MAG: sulfite exporter TauE/SafE family protein [bacterium]|nr:MAG: sulfite exporter TauE/SafE family protein [bacterium]
MDSQLAALATALWLGVLTSLSPCPLASNIAALSFLGRKVEDRSHTIISGLLYTGGRMAAYVGLAFVVVGGLLSVPSLAHFLQDSMNRFFGPVLILVGLILLGLFRLPGIAVRPGKRIEEYFQKGGHAASLSMGVVFALSFCPTSAALYFGSLIPLAVDHRSALVLPALYGAGTAAPVAFFAILVVQGAHAVGKAFGILTAFERWARRVTAVVFVLAGFYYVLTYWFGVILWR